MKKKKLSEALQTKIRMNAYESPHLQGDVEAFHGIVVPPTAGYEIESYDNRIEFLGKVYAYQLYFNYLRKNRYKDSKSPADILRERFPEVDEGVLNLPPIRFV